MFVTKPFLKSKRLAKLEKINTNEIIKDLRLQNGYGACNLCHCSGFRSRPQKDDVCDTCGHNYYKHRVWITDSGRHKSSH